MSPDKIEVLPPPSLDWSNPPPARANHTSEAAWEKIEGCIRYMAKKFGELYSDMKNVGEDASREELLETCNRWEKKSRKIYEDVNAAMNGGELPS